jgi:membrane protein required for colicin V production
LLQATDYLLLAIIAVSGIIGIFRGFLRELVAAITWVLAIWGAWTFGPDLVPHLGGVLRQQPYGLWAARGLILIGVLFVGAALGLGLGYFVRLSIFNATDRFLGFLFGLVRGIVAVGLLVILADALQLHGEPWWRQSRLLPQAERVANGLRVLIGEKRVSVGRDLLG